MTDEQIDRLIERMDDLADAMRTLAAAAARFAPPTTPPAQPPAEPAVGPTEAGAEVVHGSGDHEPARGYDVQRPPGFVPPEYADIDVRIAAEVDRYHPRSKWHAALQAELPDTVAGKAEFGRRLGRAAEINGFDPALRIDYRAEAGQYMTAAQWSAWLAANGKAGGNTVVGPT